MYKDLIKNYQSPEYIETVKQLKSNGLKGQHLYVKAFTYYKTPDILQMEETVKKLISNGDTKEAILLGLELDEYLILIDAQCKILYHEPLIEEIHKEKLRELDFYDKIKHQFECLYNKSKYSFDKEAEGLILARLDNYLFTSNSEQYNNEFIQLFPNDLIFKAFDFKNLETYYSDYLKMKTIIENAKGDLTLYIKSVDNKSKVAFIKNQFYNSNDSIIINTINHIESNLPNEPYSKFMEKLSADIVNDKKNQQAYFSFQQLPDILSSKAITKISKSEVYRDLFPFFQITHPIKCLSELDWENQRGNKVYQSYKRYQKDQVRSLLGL